MTLDDIRSALTRQFDVDTSTADGWANEAYKQAAADAKWFVETVTIGSTTSGQASYSIPAGVIQLDSLFVGGVEYSRVGEFDLTDVASSNAFLSAPGGIYAQSYSASGDDQVSLLPTPDTSTAGRAITGKGVFIPSSLTSGSSPVFPEDLHPLILEGALQIAYEREDERPDMAAAHAAKYQDGIRRLRARRLSRVRGRGPYRARVAGRDFQVS
jgi:hypothetical protein